MLAFLSYQTEERVVAASVASLLESIGVQRVGRISRRRNPPFQLRGRRVTPTANPPYELQRDAAARPVHVVWGIRKDNQGPAALVTAYPDPLLWSPDS